jgi:hypothetical protein
LARTVRHRRGIAGFPCGLGVGSAILDAFKKSALAVRQMIHTGFRLNCNGAMQCRKGDPVHGGDRRSEEFQFNNLKLTAPTVLLNRMVPLPVLPNITQPKNNGDVVSQILDFENGPVIPLCFSFGRRRGLNSNNLQHFSCYF